MLLRVVRLKKLAWVSMVDNLVSLTITCKELEFQQITSLLFAKVKTMACTTLAKELLRYWAKRITTPRVGKEAEIKALARVTEMEPLLKIK